MKNICKYLTASFIVGLLFIISSCNKSFLDKELIGVNSQSGSLNNPENARAMVNACYAYVNGGDWNQCMFPRLMMESSTDNGWGGNDYQDRPAEMAVCDFTGVNSYVSYITYYYSNMHEGIRNCNYVLANIDTVKTISSNLKNRYVGEVKFLRAYFYFELVKTFGADVLDTSFNAGDGTLFLARSPVASIYKQIYKDLQDAAAVLPEKDQYSGSDIGRATKGAALGFLAKAYLFNEDYTNAEATAQTIISSGKYALESRYSRIFEPSNANGKESLFEVNYIDVGSTFSDGYLPTQVTPATSDGGWGWFGLTSDLENAFNAAGDTVRRNATINKAGKTIDNEVPARTYPYSYNQTGAPAHTSWRHYRKFYIPLNERVGNTWPFNDIKMRYAEILLIYAEASAFNNKPAQALTALNQVRERVGLTDMTGLTGDVLKQAIWNERRLELSGEGTYRWDDIRRITINGQKLISKLLGPNGSFVIYNTTLNKDPVETLPHRESLNKGYYFKTGINELWPIPASAINNNKALTQNPGY